MKIKFQILTIGLLLMIFSVAFGQSVWTSGYSPYRDAMYPTEELVFQATIDSLNDLNSDAFNLNKYTNANWTTFPFRFEYQWSSVINKPRLQITIEGKMKNGSTWTPVDTLAGGTAKGDTLETLRQTTLNFNNLKYPQYRIKVDALAGTGALFDNASDVSLLIRMYAYQLYAQ